MKSLLLLTLLFTLSGNVFAKKSFTQIRDEQRKFFAENNQYEALKDYDELELDLLYVDLENQTILDLKHKYPELTAKELEELKTKRK